MVVVVVDGAAGPVKPNVPDRNLLVLVGGPLPSLISFFIAIMIEIAAIWGDRPEMRKPSTPGITTRIWP